MYNILMRCMTGWTRLLHMQELGLGVGWCLMDTQT